MASKPSAFVFSIVALAAVIQIPAQNPLNPMEPIASDYRNVRGLDFIATFPGDKAPPPAQLPQQWQSLPYLRTLLGIPGSPTSPPAFNDVASGVAMWECYDTTNATVMAYVDAQLERIYDAGFNTIRVWLSWHRYRFDPQGTVLRFRTLLQRCTHYGLHVIPVLWDADFFEPDHTSMAGANFINYTRWIRNPGNDVIVTQGGNLRDENRQFIIDMVTAAQTFAPGTVLMWDAMNEPLLEYGKQLTWIQQTLDTIKATSNSAATCVTPPIWKHSNASYILLANDSNLNVMAFNFYGYGQRDIEGLCENVKTLFGSNPVKPIVVMESGRVGQAMHYPESINLLSKVPANRTGNPNGNGVGFCLFSANVGEPWGAPMISSNGTLLEVNVPAWEYGDGLFYAPRFDDQANGTIFVRDYVPLPGGGFTLGAIPAIQTLAGMQGHTVNSQYTYVAMPMTVSGQPNPDYIPQPWLPDGNNRSTLTPLLANAAILGPGSGQALQSVNRVELELNAATAIAVFSFNVDFAYNFPTHPVSVLALVQMDLEKQTIRNTIADFPTSWWNEQAFLTAYQSLFGSMHGYWVAGAYDAFYR